MSERLDYDIIVIGAGQGGYVSAIKAAQAGKKVCLIENTHIGGVCLNEGCIPTKTLIRTANLLSEIKSSELFAIEGIDINKVKVSMEKLQTRKNLVVSQLVYGVKGLLLGNNITIIEGEASFVDEHTVQVRDSKLTSKHFIIATGSKVLMPSFIPLEGDTNVITSNEALNFDYIPESIVVIGGGVIGIEFAYLLSKLGTKVIVLELMDRILPMVDEEVSNMARVRMERDGITIHTGAKVKRVIDSKVVYEINCNEETVEGELVLMAVGRTSNTDGLNAENIGIEFNGRSIKTDERLRTNISNIYAVGDVNGKVMLAHTAASEGIVAVANILGDNREMDYDKIPSCIYLEPEIASIGLTEAQAIELGKKIKIGRFPLSGNGKAIVEGDTDGIIKVILEEEFNEILGVHIYGKHATDMISEMALAMTLEATAEEVIQTIHPHPTVSEIIPESFMEAIGKAIHYI